MKPDCLYTSGRTEQHDQRLTSFVWCVCVCLEEISCCVYLPLVACQPQKDDDEDDDVTDERESKQEREVGRRRRQGAKVINTKEEWRVGGATCVVAFCIPKCLCLREIE